MQLRKFYKKEMTKVERMEKLHNGIKLHKVINLHKVEKEENIFIVSCRHHIICHSFASSSEKICWHSSSQVVKWPFLMSHVTEFHVTLRPYDRTEPSFSNISPSPAQKCFHPKEEEGIVYSLFDDSVATITRKVT